MHFLFLSYGGSSLFSNMIMIGLILSVHKKL
ncbi:FtsW/RodA/SpoVE family cell cycle protein [Bacillus cereus]